MKEGDTAKLKGRLRIFGTLARVIELRGKYAMIEVTEPKGRPLRVLVDVHKLEWFPKQGHQETSPNGSNLTGGDVSDGKPRVGPEK